MAYRQLPNSTPRRYRALKAIMDRKAVTLPANLPFTQATIDRLNVFFPAYHDAIQNLSTTLYNQTSITVKVVKAKQLATWFLNDFIDALQNAIRRGTIAPNFRALYSLPIEKRFRPQIKTEQDVLEWAVNIHDGETERIAQGGVPITFPSLAEVDAATGDFRTKNLQQSNDKNAYDKAQEAVQAENKKADLLILKCWNEIESEYDVGDKPSLRRKAREWGVIYVPRKGEKVQEE